MSTKTTSQTDGQHPYRDLPPKAFWRSGVTEPGAFKINSLWSPKFDIGQKDRVITAGSCFAQHIGRALKNNGFSWYDAEPAPPMLDEASAKAFNYGVFSFRTGNIYTAALLDQWTSWATGEGEPSDELWEHDGRFYDPYRPQIEPNGFTSAKELIATRQRTLNAIYHALETADVFVFTLGLTEAWRNRDTGLVYAACPGTLAGDFNPEQHEFVNFSYPDILSAMEAFIDKAGRINPGMRFLLTVSPVPLTATAAPDQHVLVATSYSKSVLRAVAGSLATRYDHVDYFPSYEIITGFPFRGMFFEPNMRSVDPRGVDFVMEHFFSSLTAAFGSTGQATTKNTEPTASHPKTAPDQDEVVCEDAVLEFYNAN